jgi:hypothetical protein
MVSKRTGRTSIRRIGVAAAAALLSLAGTAWLTRAVLGTLPERDLARTYVSAPADRAAVVGKAPDAADRLRRNPTDPDAFNLVYVAIARRDGVESATAQRAAAVLGRYGWRSTAAQQNLIEAAAYREDYPAVLDRTDALLRRNKLRPQMAQVLAVLEKDPGQQPRVVSRLLGHPNWRQDYLWRIGTTNDRALLDARMGTLLALLDRGDTLSREELSRSLQALIAADRQVQANQLWRRAGGRSRTGNLLYDPRFEVVQREGARPAFGIPYEWSLQSGAGYSAGLRGGTWPLQIDWVGATAGLPIFLRQVVALDAPARGFVLRVGAESPEQVRDNLVFTLGCGAEEAAFALREIRGHELTYTLTVGVPACLAPAFAMVGHPEGRGADALRLSDFRLTALR